MEKVKVSKNHFVIFSLYNFYNTLQSLYKGKRSLVQYFASNSKKRTNLWMSILFLCYILHSYFGAFFKW